MPKKASDSQSADATPAASSKKTAASSAKKSTAAAAKKSAPVDSPATAPAAKANGQHADKGGESTVFLKKQKQRLIELRDSMLDALDGVARETIRSRAEGSEASAFGMHQADAGSDAYDRDFALQLLAKEQDALYEIEEALKRIDAGTYGTCEMSGKKIAPARLEAIPFARYTVECQAQIEKERRPGGGRRPPVRSLFGLGTDEDGDEDEEGSDAAPASSND